MYISSYWPPNPISTVQSEEPHVMDHLSKFHLNRTVNESGNAVLQKLHEPEKLVAPSAQNQEHGAWRYKPSVGRFLFPENTKNSIFHESEYHASLVWRLAAKWVPPGGSCTCEPYVLHIISISIHCSTPSHANLVPNAFFQSFPTNFPLKLQP